MTGFKMLICCPFLSRNTRYDDIDDHYAPSSEAPTSESSSLLRSGDASLADAYRASYRSWEDDVNLWSDPYDATHTRSSQDKELDGLIRDWRKANTEREKTIIYQKMQAIRLQRKRVQDRWKTLLAELGFTTEVDRLVSVSSASGVSLPSPPSDQAMDMHRVLVHQTELFGDAEVQDRRYSIVLDRLIALDVADDFVAKARELFPKESNGI